jgi:hypothetical protein
MQYTYRWSNLSIKQQIEGFREVRKGWLQVRAMMFWLVSGAVRRPEPRPAEKNVPMRMCP